MPRPVQGLFRTVSYLNPYEDLFDSDEDEQDDPGLIAMGLAIPKDWQCRKPKRSKYAPKSA